jgi:uroporphyrinogen-III synthase
MPAANFQGLTVLNLESRRGRELSRLIESYGGRPIHAPAMREVPLSSNLKAFKFAEELFLGKFDAVLFLTGAGARALLQTIESAHPRDKFFAALRRVTVIARGPKPQAVLREWNVPVAVAAPEPNTWREVLQAVDYRKLDLRDKRVAVQEYGVSNPELLEGLRQRGAQLTPVPIYQWDLPEDIAPLRSAVDSIVAGKIAVALFTTGVQVAHLFRIADQLGKSDALKTAMRNVVKASIGPSTSETLASFGLSADLEASRPKMGFLVKEAAGRAQHC